MEIIGLVGRRGSGKTTAFKAISRKYETNEITIASYLKELCSKLFNLSYENFDDPAIKDLPWETPVKLNQDHLKILTEEMEINSQEAKLLKTFEGTKILSPRFALQFVGTQILRLFRPRLQIEKAVAKLDPKKLNVITDIRFWDEFDAFKDSYRFLPLYVKRGKETSDNHESERYIEAIGKSCLLIENRTDLRAFECSILEAVKTHLSNDQADDKVA